MSSSPQKSNCNHSSFGRITVQRTFSSRFPHGFPIHAIWCGGHMFTMGARLPYMMSAKFSNFLTSLLIAWIPPLSSGTRFSQPWNINKLSSRNLRGLKNVKRDALALAFELATGLQTWRKMCMLGCVNHTQTRAQPSPRIFLHVCTYNWSFMPPFMHKIKNERKKKRKLLFFLSSFFYYQNQFTNTQNQFTKPQNQFTKPWANREELC